MRGFIKRKLRTQKQAKLNMFLVKHEFIMEYISSVDKYCGRFIRQESAYNDLINSHILWFDGDTSLREIKSIIKSKFDNNLFYKEENKRC